jgi:hypothetical protein
MPAIYTNDWYTALRELINRNPEVEKNAPRGRLTVLGEIKGDGMSPYLPVGEQMLFVVRFEDGKCIDYVQVASPPPRRDLNFIFELRASVFEGVAAGVVDPVAAGLKGTIKIIGDMRILIKHAELVNTLREVYAREVETAWPKGRPPYPGQECARLGS